MSTNEQTKQNGSLAENGENKKQRFRQSLLRIFAAVVFALLLAIVAYGCIFTVRLYRSKRESEYLSARSSLLFALSKCANALSGLQAANDSAVIAFSSGRKASSNFHESASDIYIYASETGDLNTVALSGTAPGYLADLKQDIGRFLDSPGSFPFAYFSPDLLYAFCIAPLNPQEGTFMVSVTDDTDEIRDLLSLRVFDGSVLFISDIENRLVFSRNISQGEIRDWNIHYRQAAFDTATALESRQIIEIDDHLLFRFPLFTSGYYFSGSLKTANVYSPFFYDLLPLLVFSAVLIVGAVYGLLKFKNNIYLPIVEIEKGINGITKGDMDLEIVLSESNEFFPMSQQINNMIRHLRTILDREYNEKILLKQAQISALQSQINPHFLYNTFDSMRGQAMAQGATQITDLLKSLSDLFKYSISKKSETVTLADELNNVDNYLYIQQYRFNDKFVVKKQIESDARHDILSYRMPKLTLQPIVENSLIHGIEPKSDNGILYIRAYTTRHNLVIEIEDNGKGMSSEMLQEFNKHLRSGIEITDIKERDAHHTGIGMLNVNDRIQLLYGKKYGIRLYSTQDIGTMVQIVLPLIPA